MGGSLDTKARLRRDLVLRRRAIAGDEVVRASRAVCEHVATSIQYRSARAIVLYAARAGEPDPAALANHPSIGVDAFFPRVEGDSLVFRRANVAELRPGAFGILEPPSHSPVLGADRTGVLVVVPGLAFDRAGNRLGSGKGYYDRVLTGYPLAQRVGLAFAAFVVSPLPADPWDVPMHAVVTERGMIIADAVVGVQPGDA